MDTANWVQIPDKAVCISQSANTLGKDMNPTILPLATGKIVGQTNFFSVGIATNPEKGKLYKPVVLHLRIDLVSHLACV